MRTIVLCGRCGSDMIGRRSLRLHGLWYFLGKSFCGSFRNSVTLERVGGVLKKTAINYHVVRFFWGQKSKHVSLHNEHIPRSWGSLCTARCQVISLSKSATNMLWRLSENVSQNLSEKVFPSKHEKFSNWISSQTIPNLCHFVRSLLVEIK